MSIHVGFASRRNFLRSATAAQVHADSTLSVTSQPIVVSHARELRARVDQALQAGERHLARSREKGAVLDFLNLSGSVRASMRDLHLEERLGLV